MWIKGQQTMATAKFNQLLVLSIKFYWNPGAYIHSHSQSEIVEMEFTEVYRLFQNGPLLMRNRNFAKILALVSFKLHSLVEICIPCLILAPHC